MIDVQQAVEYCAGLFREVARVRLEEVELTDDDKHWLITVGFEESWGPGSQITELIQGFVPRDPQRQYRVVSVNAETGQVHAVKIRQPLEQVS